LTKFKEALVTTNVAVTLQIVAVGFAKYF